MKNIDMKENTIQKLEDEYKKCEEEMVKPVEIEGCDEEFVELMNDFIAHYKEDDNEEKGDNDDSVLFDFDDEEDVVDEVDCEEDDEEDDDDEGFEESLAFLDDMVGMEHVKEKLLRLGRYSRWLRKLEYEGYSTFVYPNPNLTFMFLGDPGTGKTTVAEHMGKILYRAGLLSDEEVYVYRREDLVGQNYGCEEENTKEALRKSRGGVLFLDEAYQCFKQSTDKRDPGYHILETLMARFSEPDRCIIMAGYKDEMQELFKVNPGFRSRIPDDNIIEFTGPSEQLLIDVASNAFRKMRFSLTPDAEALLEGHIHSMWVNKDKDFGNARVIRQLAEAVVINHANRIIAASQSDDFVITEEDIRQSIPQKRTKSVTRSRIGFV